MGAVVAHATDEMARHRSARLRFSRLRRSSTVVGRCEVGAALVRDDLTGLRAGLRLGELRALHWQDVDLVARKLMVRQSAAKNDIGTPKSGHSREVDLGTEVAAALKSHRHLRSEYVFAHESGRMLTENECKHPLRRAHQRAG